QAQSVLTKADHLPRALSGHALITIAIQQHQKLIASIGIHLPEGPLGSDQYRLPVLLASSEDAMHDPFGVDRGDIGHRLSIAEFQEPPRAHALKAIRLLSLRQDTLR